MTRNQDLREGNQAQPVFAFSIIGTIISILAAALLGYLVFLISSDEMAVMAGVGAGIMTATLLCVAANAGKSRSATVIKSTSWALIVPVIIVSLLLGWLCNSHSIVIVVDGLILLAYLAIILSVAKSGQ